MGGKIREIFKNKKTWVFEFDDGKNIEVVSISLQCSCDDWKTYKRERKQICSHIREVFKFILEEDKK